MKNEDIIFEELDVGKITSIPSDVEIPVHDNFTPTKRPLCTNFPENSTILDRIDAITVITDIADDLEESEETCINNIPQYIKELLGIYDTLDPVECESDLFDGKEYSVVDNAKDLQKLLSELIIRFDTDPKFYTREDYAFLMAVLYKSLLFIYNKEIKRITLGDNLSQIAYVQDHFIDLKYPVAVPGDTIINEEQTLPSVAYLDKFVLRWEEI